MRHYRLFLFLLAGGLWIACTPEPTSNTHSSGRSSVIDSAEHCRKGEALLKCAKAGASEADSLLLLALDHFRKGGQKEGWVAAWTERFRHYRKREAYEQIGAELEQAVQQRWWSEDEYAGRLYAMLGYCLRQMGRNYAAGIYYEKARLLSEQFGRVTPRNPAGPIYKTLANIKTRLGETEEAQKLFLTALDLLQRDTSRQEAVANAFTTADILSDLGIAYQNAGKPAEAIAEYDKGLLQLQRLSSYSSADPVRLGNTLGMLLSNKAAALAQLGRLNEAASNAREALKWLSPDKHNYRFNALAVQADIWVKIGNWARAFAAWEEALKAADRHASDIEAREVSKVLVKMGWAVLRQGEVDTAGLLAQRALQVLYPRLSATDLSDNPDPRLFDPDPESAVAEALDLKSEVLWQQFIRYGYTQALNWADSTTCLAIEMMENLLDIASYESSKLISSQQSRHLFGRILRILHAQHRLRQPGVPERAFQYAERSRAILLRQKISMEALLHGAQITDSLANRERDLREQCAFWRNALFQHINRNGRAEDSLGQVLQRQIFRVEQEQRHLRQGIAQQYGLALNQSSVPLISAAHLRENLLQADEQWISYFTDVDSQWVYLIDLESDRALFMRRPFREAAVTAFLAPLSSPVIAENRSADTALWRCFVNQAHALYQELLAPVLSARTRRLILSPDGVLVLLPFDILLEHPIAPNAPVDYGALPYLGQRVRIRLALSASLEHFYAQQPRHRPQCSYVGFAPRYDGTSLEVVRGGTSVIQEMGQRLSGKAFCDDQATKEAFLRHAPRSAILHFYGHAEAFDSFPDYSWMAFTVREKSPVGDSVPSGVSLDVSTSLPSFAQDTHLLFAHQIYHTWLSAEVVLLSGCRTGTGKIALGEGALSLARAFQAAGCPAVVLSLWKVRDDATTSLIRSLLRHLQSGLPKDEALFLAKREYVHTAPDPFPYFWAGFALMGSAEPIRLPCNISLTGGIAAALLIAAVAGWFIMKQRRYISLHL